MTHGQRIKSLLTLVTLALETFLPIR